MSTQLGILRFIGVVAISAFAFAARAETDGQRLASVEPAAQTDTAGTAAGGEAATLAEPLEPKKPLVVARVDLSDQRMYVYVDEHLFDVFKVSTARKGYVTPTGRYRAQWLSRNHRSRKYDWAPMPYSVFFHEGWAVHGTTDLKRLGRPASHGCVRLHPKNAKAFFDLVKVSGKENTIISVVR
jgi:hypothetical protein